MMRNFWRGVADLWKDKGFLHTIGKLQTVLAKVLSLAMILVIIVATIDLIRIIIVDLALDPRILLNRGLFEIFGMFLNILIALEILENITAYLRSHVIQVELVIVTSLVAIARKIIILDLDKTTGLSIIGLGVAIIALSTSYLIIRISHQLASDDN